MVDGVIGPDTAVMTGGTDRTAAGTGRGVGHQGKIGCARMTGRTAVMLLVVATVGKERIVNGLGMAIQTGSLGVHTVGGVMIDVMGEQVQGRAVIYITMATGTVAAADTAGSCCYQAVVVTSRINVTGDTGVMDRVVGRINRKPGSYRRYRRRRLYPVS